MKEQVRQFLKDQEQALALFDHTVPGNVIYAWNGMQNPWKSVLNALVIKICKHMPSRVNGFLLRNLLHMKIGKNVGIASEVDFDGLFPELITVEDNAIIGWRVNILCHEFTQKQVRLGRVHVKRNALVGAFSVIRSGITIGENSVVAMCSFVNKDVPDNEVWGGVPAKRIKKLTL